MCGAKASSLKPARSTGLARLGRGAPGGDAQRGLWVSCGEARVRKRQGSLSAVRAAGTRADAPLLFAR